MFPSRRQFLRLGVLSTVTTLAGCSSNNPETSTPTGTTTESPVLTTVSPGSDLPVRCPARIDVYGITPVPPPRKPSPLTRSAVIEFTKEYEEMYMENLAIREYGVNTSTSTNGTPDPRVKEPIVSLDALSIGIYDESANGYFIRLEYILSVDGTKKSKLTVNYFVSREMTIRAQEKGHQGVGPDPLQEGVVMDC